MFSYLLQQRYYYNIYACVLNTCTDAGNDIADAVDLKTDDGVDLFEDLDTKIEDAIEILKK